MEREWEEEEEEEEEEEAWGKYLAIIRALAPPLKIPGPPSQII